MNERWMVTLTMAVTIGSLMWPTLGATRPRASAATRSSEESATRGGAANARIVRGPDAERIDADFAIVRWTSTTPAGSPVHFGVVHYGTDARNLGRTAQSSIRLNPAHPETVFRVRLDGLRPRTTYYFRVDTKDADGIADTPESPVRRFTTR